MAYTRTGLQDIYIPKTRNYEDATYTYTAFAREINFLTSEVGWACLRTKKSNGDTDWANVSGKPTNDYLFLGTEVVVVALSYGEA